MTYSGCSSVEVSLKVTQTRPLSFVRDGLFWARGGCHRLYFLFKQHSSFWSNLVFKIGNEKGIHSNPYSSFHWHTTMATKMPAHVSSQVFDSKCKGALFPAVSSLTFVTNIYQRLLQHRKQCLAVAVCCCHECRISHHKTAWTLQHYSPDFWHGWVSISSG